MIRQEVNIQNIFTSETIEKKVNTYHLIFINAYAILTVDGMVAVNLQIEPLRVEGICLYHDG